MSNSSMHRVWGHPSPCPSPTPSAQADFVGGGEGTLLQSLGPKPLSPRGRGVGVRGPRESWRKSRRGAAAIGLTALALVAWGWFSATLVAPQPTPILLDRNGGFLA